MLGMVLQAYDPSKTKASLNHTETSGKETQFNLRNPIRPKIHKSAAIAELPLQDLFDRTESKQTLFPLNINFLTASRAPSNLYSGAWLSDGTLVYPHKTLGLPYRERKKPKHHQEIPYCTHGGTTL